MATNLPYADWNGNAGGNSETQALINSLVWENGYSQVIDSPTRGDALLDVYLVRPESSVTSSSIVQGVSDHHEVMLEIEWENKCSEPQVERTIQIQDDGRSGRRDRERSQSSSANRRKKR